MDSASLSAELRTARLGRAVHYAKCVDSTNTWAMAAIARGEASDGAVFLAERQTAGRGTAGRRWLSEGGEGLWMSLVLHDPVSVAPLSFLPCIALVDVLRADLAVEAHLKWPNDVLLDDRKVAGCLVEAQTGPGRALSWVLGLGVNVSQVAFPPAIRNTAVSLRMATGRIHSRERLCARILGRIEELVDSRADLVDLWRQRSRMLGRRIVAQRPGGAVAVTVLGLTERGHLEVLRENGEREEWLARTDFELEEQAP